MPDQLIRPSAAGHHVIIASHFDDRIVAAGAENGISEIAVAQIGVRKSLQPSLLHAAVVILTGPQHRQHTYTEDKNNGYTRPRPARIQTCLRVTARSCEGTGTLAK